MGRLLWPGMKFWSLKKSKGGMVWCEFNMFLSVMKIIAIWLSYWRGIMNKNSIFFHVERRRKCLKTYCQICPWIISCHFWGNVKPYHYWHSGSECHSLSLTWSGWGLTLPSPLVCSAQGIYGAWARCSDSFQQVSPNFLLKTCYQIGFLCHVSL